MQATELRLAGNAEARGGDLERAIDLYTQVGLRFKDSTLLDLRTEHFGEEQSLRPCIVLLNSELVHAARQARCLLRRVAVHIFMLPAIWQHVSEGECICTQGLHLPSCMTCTYLHSFPYLALCVDGDWLVRSPQLLSASLITRALLRDHPVESTCCCQIGRGHCCLLGSCRKHWMMPMLLPRCHPLASTVHTIARQVMILVCC